MLRAVKLVVLSGLLALGAAGCRGNLDPDTAELLRWLMLIAFGIAVLALVAAVLVKQSDQRLTALASAALVAVLGIVFLFVLVA